MNVLIDINLINTLKELLVKKEKKKDNAQL